MRHALTSAALVLIALNTGCTLGTSAQPEPRTVAEQSQPIPISLEKGQVLSYILINSKNTEEARNVRQTYYSKAFPLSSNFGLERVIDLKVPASYVGNTKRDAVIMFSYPDAASEAGLANHPEWPAIKAMRPDAWDELIIFTGELDKTIAFNFDPKKAYTLAVAEINPEAPEAYNTYMRGIEPGLNEMGGRFIYRMIDPKIESHGKQYDKDVQVTLVEWSDPSAIGRFTRTDTYKASAPYFTEGVQGFEFFEIAPAKPAS